MADAEALPLTALLSKFSCLSLPPPTPPSIFCAPFSSCPGLIITMGLPALSPAIPILTPESSTNTSQAPVQIDCAYYLTQRSFLCCSLVLRNFSAYLLWKVYTLFPFFTVTCKILHTDLTKPTNSTLALPQKDINPSTALLS